MGNEFDVIAITDRGWRQGSALGPSTARLAVTKAPPHVTVEGDDVLLVMSHDCDVASPDLGKEPFVEIVRARRLKTETTSKQSGWGRHPRYLETEIDLAGLVVLGCAIHERWLVPRDWLAAESPAGELDATQRRVAAEWLAKRYLRAAFPTAFDLRWRGEMKR